MSAANEPRRGAQRALSEDGPTILQSAISSKIAVFATRSQLANDFSNDSGIGLASVAFVPPDPKRFVYIIPSRRSQRPSVGLTSNIERRLTAHNLGGNRSTASHAPWELIVSMAFATEPDAALFERYLKSSSGRAFVRRYLLN